MILPLSLINLTVNFQYLEQEYYKTDQKLLTDSNAINITELYSKGYVLTRLKKGLYNQTRSLRIDLSKFELNSENKRILSKNEGLNLQVKELPYANYSWEIHKMGKDFYTIKFGDGTMSASKIKELFLETDKSNVNAAFEYIMDNKDVGFCLSYINESIVHYSYPFYDLDIPKENSLGMAMMLKAIIWAKQNNKQYIYLGSIIDSKAKYKLQFEGLEWFNTDLQQWSSNIEELKAIIN